MGSKFLKKFGIILSMCVILTACGEVTEVNSELGTDILVDMPVLPPISDTTETEGSSELSETTETETELGIIPEETTVATVHIPEETSIVSTTKVTESVTSESSTTTENIESESVTEQTTEATEVTEPIVEAEKIGTSEGIKRITRAFLSQSTEDNSCLFSGYSAYSALMYVYPYTMGETRTEIEEVLGAVDVEAFRAKQADFNRRYEAQVDNSTPLFNELLLDDTAKKPMNGALESHGLFLIDDNIVLNTEKKDNFEFRDLASDEIVSYVNTYVSNRTHNLISQLISKPFDTDTKAVILDTLYFKDAWSVPFKQEDTQTQTFYGKNGEQSVAMMHNTATYEVYENIIRLKYNGTPVVMEIVKDITDKAEAFEYYCANYFNVVATEDVRLQLPQFELETKTNLNNTFQGMGINTIFEQGSADISLLSDDLYISNIVQKGKIKVAEEGTEAAAVTMVTMDTNALVTEKQYVDFIVDHPFMFVLRNTETDEILFTGYYYNM